MCSTMLLKLKRTYFFLSALFALLKIVSLGCATAPKTTTLARYEYCDGLPDIDESRSRVKTKNNFGAMYCFNSPLTNLFLEDIDGKKLNILEIGPAFGAKTIQILNRGSSVDALEIDEKHLSILQRHVRNYFRKRNLRYDLEIFLGSATELPQAVKNKAGSYDAILSESVFHFLPPQELQKALANAYLLLKPEGKIYIMVSSVYLKHVHQWFLEQKEMAHAWPGFFGNVNSRHADLARLNPNYHFFDHETLQRELAAQGFTVVLNRYVPLPHQEFDLALDGREGLMMVAQK